MLPTRQRIVLLHLGGTGIRTTAEHPFYVIGRGWTAAADLRPGDALLATDGQTTTLGGVADASPGESPVSNPPAPSTTPRPIIGFAAGTPIRTPEGSKPIGDSNPVDLIVSKSDEAEDAVRPDPRWWEWN